MTTHRWIVVVGGVALGGLLLFYYPAHPIVSGLIALLVIKHVGLGLLVGSPLAALTSRRLERFRSLCPLRNRFRR